MLAAFGHTWSSQYGDHPAGITAETWASALAGITGQQIGEGLRACIAEGQQFPPGAPRFRAMCLGIPAFAQVKLESTRTDAERSPFTRAVWMFVDGYSYRHAALKDADRMLREAYELASEQRMRGAPLPDPPAAALEGPSESIVELPPTREARLNHLKDVLGDDFNPSVADPAYDPTRH